MAAKTAKTAKTVNYTPEQTQAILDAYANGSAVEAIAETVGKSVRSIVAKLSREGVYKKKEYKRRMAKLWLKRTLMPMPLELFFACPKTILNRLLKQTKAH